MADAARVVALVSSDEYLAEENGAAWRHEFVNGVAYAMVGTSDRHNLVALNLAGALNAHLPTRCQVFMSDVKVEVRRGADHRFYYPDVFVTCAPSEMGRYMREEPLLVAEVLSPTTERIDRGEKFEAYKGLPSLQEYVLLAQDERRVELYRRRTGWAREVVGPGGEAALESADLALPLDVLYRRTGL